MSDSAATEVAGLRTRRWVDFAIIGALILEVGFLTWGAQRDPLRDEPVESWPTARPGQPILLAIKTVGSQEAVHQHERFVFAHDERMARANDSEIPPAICTPVADEYASVDRDDRVPPTSPD